MRPYFLTRYDLILFENEAGSKKGMTVMKSARYLDWQKFWTRMNSLTRCSAKPQIC